MIFELTTYLLLGALVGTLAGLLGIGGGLIIVPVLVAVFSHQGFAADITMQLALGTSLASIIATSISSVYSHHKHGAVLWSAATKLAPGILIGAWCGALFASNLSSETLKPIFAFFELMVAGYILWGGKTRPHNTAPSLLNYGLSGSIIGFVSSLVGIGGGTMSTPWLVWHGKSIHKAIATSASLGFPIAISGSFGYLASGWNHPDPPEYATGFIYLPALGGIVLSSIFFAPLGAGLAHKMDVKQLKKIFALLLIALAIYLLSF